jgi:hypothetical protein
LTVKQAEVNINVWFCSRIWTKEAAMSFLVEYQWLWSPGNFRKQNFRTCPLALRGGKNATQKKSKSEFNVTCASCAVGVEQIIDNQFRNTISPR